MQLNDLLHEVFHILYKYNIPIPQYQSEECNQIIFWWYNKDIEEKWKIEARIDLDSNCVVNVYDYENDHQVLFEALKFNIFEIINGKH